MDTRVRGGYAPALRAYPWHPVTADTRKSQIQNHFAG